jgi:histidine phosphotransferase ChpT
MSQELILLELLMTKLCHDLSAPIGAVYNGVEFLESEDNPALLENPAYELVSSNAQIAVKKLKFFRYIYGKSDAKGEVDTQYLKQIVEDFFADTKIKLELHQGQKYVALTGGAAKLVAVLCYIASFFLIYGGKITVNIERRPGVKAVQINAISEQNLKQSWNLEAVMADTELKEIRLSNAIVYLAAIIARELKVKLITRQLTNELFIDFEFKNSEFDI